MTKLYTRLLAPALALLLPACVHAAASPNLSLNVDKYRSDHPATLGLEWAPSLDHVTVYAPQNQSDYAYNHGAVLTVFKGQFFMQWQSSKRNEDSAETRVMYSVSPDGVNWREPIVLANPRSGAVTTNGGWYHDDENLVAYLNIWPGKGDPGNTPRGFTEFMVSPDGMDWSDAEPVLDISNQPIKGVIEQDLRQTSDGRILTSFHSQPGLQATPYYTRDRLGISGWTAGEMQQLPSEGPVSRALEPAWYETQNNTIIMVFRDQESSFQTLVSESHDGGESWSTPKLSTFPDSRSKQSAGNLPDGTAFRVNNPRRDNRRFPLVLSLSQDGYNFDRAYLLRSGLSDLPPMEYDGRYKRHGYSYPKSVVHEDNLYVAYAVNKEKIALTILPISSLQP